MSKYIKEIDEISDLACEVIGLSICNHSAIVKMIDLEYVDQKARLHLPKYIDINEHKLTFNECLQVIYDICSAMSYLRMNGMMHRDIKEQNVMIFIDTDGGKIRGVLIDFGLCTFIVGSLFLKPCSTITHRAPEVCNSLFNSNADVWSLGFFIYGLVAGHSWKDMAYDAGWFTGDYEEKEWMEFVTHPETKILIKDTIMTCENSMTDTEKQFFVRLISGCLQDEKYRYTETDVMGMIDKYYASCIVRPVIGPKLVKRHAATLDEKIKLSDRCIGVIKMQVSYVREHIYGVLDFGAITDERLIYTLIYSIVFMYDNNEKNIWEFPTIQDFVELHHLIKDWRTVLFL